MGLSNDNSYGNDNARKKSHDWLTEENNRTITFFSNSFLTSSLLCCRGFYFTTQVSYYYPIIIILLYSLKQLGRSEKRETLLLKNKQTKKQIPLFIEL